ncbi:hypothetical protein ACPEEZ_14695 [Frigoribacterium sp. 2-23]|uniref:hypothetical protein n=1 Tax=Frigoribacterium sp. 2-23 TaxID=3415006 RepID=UPI003C6F2246
MPHSSWLQREPTMATTGDDHGLLLDDWADFYGTQPDDLVFECVVDTGASRAGISIYLDRIVVEEEDALITAVHPVASITAWSIRPHGATQTEVEITSRTHSRTHVPRPFAGAITIALTEALGPQTS